MNEWINDLWIDHSPACITSVFPTDVDSARRGEKHIAQNVFARINSVINEL